MYAINTCVEESNRHAAAVLVGEPDVRALAELAARQQTRAERSRIGGAHGIHTRHVRGALEQSDSTRVERRRETVDGMRVTELGLDDDALETQAGNEQLLGRERRLCPSPFVFARRQASDAAHAVRQCRCLEQDDDSRHRHWRTAWADRKSTRL